MHEVDLQPILSASRREHLHFLKKKQTRFQTINEKYKCHISTSNDDNSLFCSDIQALQGLCESDSGGWRMENTDDKMRMTKCG